MTSTSGNEALDKGHAISYVKDCRKLLSIVLVLELGKFVRYIESSLCRTPRFNEFSKKNNQSVRYIEVQLIINLQNPVFPDLRH